MNSTCVIEDNKVIDDVVNSSGFTSVKKRVDRKQFEQFNADDYMDLVTDYSAFSFFGRHSMVFDAVVNRLQDAIGYTTNLLAYAERNINDDSLEKIGEVRYARDFFRQQLKNIKERNSGFEVFSSKKHGSLEAKLPWHTAHETMHTIPLSGKVYDKQIKPYLHPAQG